MEQRVVVISGASSGIGQAMARRYKEQGHRVYALARSLTGSLDEAAQKPSAGNLNEGVLISVRLDVTDAAASASVIRQIGQREGRIDILVLAAGIGLAGSVEDMAPEEHARQMATNYLGICHVLAPALAIMRQSASGLVIPIASVAGFMPVPFQAGYSASKAAVAALVQAMVNEVRPYGIRAMIVQPGDTQTGFTQARVMAQAGRTSVYAERCSRSIAKMAADEQNGMPADKMAGLIIARAARRKPPLYFTPGLLYKTAWLLNRLLPRRLVNWVLYLMYAR